MIHDQRLAMLMAGEGRHKIDCDGSCKRIAVPPGLARLSQLKVTSHSSCMDIALVLNHTSSLKSQAVELGRYSTGRNYPHQFKDIKVGG